MRSGGGKVETQDGNQVERALGFLQRQLATGARPAKELYELARNAHGISRAMLWTAKKELGIVDERVGFGRGSVVQWRLPRRRAAKVTPKTKTAAPLGPRVSIYGLCDPQTMVVRYIGKTRHSLSARLAGHLDEAARSAATSGNRKVLWLRRLLACGQRPASILLDVGDERTWRDLERFHIGAHRTAGFDLLNASLGGEAGASRPQCAVTDCGRIAVVEALLYDVYLDGAGRCYDVFMERDHDCGHLCAEHLAQNEERATRTHLDLAAPAPQEREGCLSYVSMDQLLSAPRRREPAGEGRSYRDGVDYPYTNQLRAQGFTIYRPLRGRSI